MSEETLVGEQINNDAEVKTEVVNEQVDSGEKSLVDSGAVETPEEKEVAPAEEEIVYGDFVVPEGIVLDEAHTAEFKNVAKELKLSQDQAQKLVDIQTKVNLAHAEKMQADFKEQVNQWREESIKELGPNYKAELQVVAKALDSFGSPELRQLLNDTGLGNHKEVVKFFHNIGKKVSEDTFRDGKGKEEPKSLAQKLYTNTRS